MNTFKIGDAVKILPEFMSTPAAEDCTEDGVFVVSGLGLEGTKVFAELHHIDLKFFTEDTEYPVEDNVFITDDVGDLCGFVVQQLELVVLD